MRVLFPRMKYADFIECMKDERFLALTVLVCNQCYFEITQKHDKMSKDAGFKPHKGDIIKLLKKEKLRVAEIEVSEEESEDDIDNEEELKTYITEKKPRSIAGGRGDPATDSKSRISTAHGYHHQSGQRHLEEQSAYKVPSSTNYTEGRPNSNTLGGRVFSGKYSKASFRVTSSHAPSESGRIGLDSYQARKELAAKKSLASFRMKLDEGISSQEVRRITNSKFGGASQAALAQKPRIIQRGVSAGRLISKSVAQPVPQSAKGNAYQQQQQQLHDQEPSNRLTVDNEF